MLRYGSHHDSQLDGLLLALRSTPYWERSVIIDDFLRDVKQSRSEMRSRYRNLTKRRKKLLSGLYRQHRRRFRGKSHYDAWRMTHPKGGR